jgi:hypothetical protein
MRDVMATVGLLDLDADERTWSTGETPGFAGMQSSARPQGSRSATTSRTRLAHGALMEAMTRIELCLFQAPG